MQKQVIDKERNKSLGAYKDLGPYLLLANHLFQFPRVLTAFTQFLTFKTSFTTYIFHTFSANIFYVKDL